MTDSQTTRLETAELALELLANGALPRLKALFFSGGFEVCSARDLDIAEGAECGENAGCIGRVSIRLKEHCEGAIPQIRLETSTNLCPDDIALISQTTGELIAVMFAALGLDMRRRPSAKEGPGN